MTRPSGEFGPTIEPATLTSEAPWLTGPLQNLSSLAKVAVTDAKDQPVFIVFDLNLVPGQFITAFCESGIPDYWLATVRPATGVKLSMFISASSSGIPIRIGGGGQAKLPGMSEYFTVLCETGSSAAIVTLIAVRGYKDLSIDGGDLV